MANLYHVLNRGVDGRDIFMDEQDRFRFIHDLYELNDQDVVNTTFHIFSRSNDLRGRKVVDIEKKPRKLLVDIHAFAMMPNHYHLMLSAKVDGGISKFLNKLNMGYVKYFNYKNKRKGTLFQGRTKKILISDESHFVHLPYYIHLNPLDLNSPEWRERKLVDHKKALIFLEKYRWSSHMDYVGIKNFPSVTNRELLLDYFGGSEGYKNAIYNWLKNIKEEQLEEFKSYD